MPSRHVVVAIENRGLHVDEAAVAANESSGKPNWLA